MLFFKVEQVFQLMGDIWLTKNTDTQCTMLGEKKRAKDREKILCLNFFYFAIKYKFFHSGKEIQRLEKWGSERNRDQGRPG